MMKNEIIPATAANTTAAPVDHPGQVAGQSPEGSGALDCYCCAACGQPIHQQHHQAAAQLGRFQPPAADPRAEYERYSEIHLIEYERGYPGPGLGRFFRNLNNNDWRLGLRIAAVGYLGLLGMVFLPAGTLSVASGALGIAGALAVLATWSPARPARAAAEEGKK